MTLFIGSLSLLGVKKVVLAQNQDRFEVFKNDLLELLNQPGVQAALLFTPFGSNPDQNFTKHRLSDNQIETLCEGSCSTKNIGANFGTIYKGGRYDKARQHQMNWSLEIARAGSEQAIIDVINNEGINNVIIRVGVGGSALGLEDPQVYATFLKRISDGIGGKTFYAIVGPNEPDIENWAHHCGSPSPGKEEWYDCVGSKLAKYMNTVLNSGLPDNVKLLSPAFNFTSYTFNDQGESIALAMKESGARFDKLYAIAGNIYPNGQAMVKTWQEHVTPIISQLGNNRVIITETGPWEKINKDSGYDKSRFDDYDIDETKFYLYPIKSLKTKDVNAIRSELVSQGYQAYCATPKYYLNPSLGPQDIVKKFLELNGPITMPFNSKFVLDFTGARTPIFRDTSDKRFLFASMEEFFGFLDTKDPDSVSQAELNSGPINSLLTRPQRCKTAIRLLVQTKIFCEKLENPDVCALYDQKIPDTEFTYRTLLGTVMTNTPRLGNKIDEPCNDWLAKYPNDEKIKKMVQALYLTPLYLDRAYRLAFLVMSVKQVPKEPNRLFNFFLPKNEQASWEETLAIAFKIPDLGTNEVLDEVNKRTDYLKKLINNQVSPNQIRDNFEERIDPLKLTQKSLTAINKQLEQDEKRQELSQRLRDLATLAHNQIPGEDAIYCAGGGTACDPKQAPLGRALIDIINGQWRDDELRKEMFCTNTSFEGSSIISDNANLKLNDANQAAFKETFGKEILKFLFKPDSLEGNETAEVEIKSEYEVKPDTYKQGGETEVKFYLVYPAGYELKEVEEALAGAFFTTEELKSLNYRDPYKKSGFPMQSTLTNFTPGSEGRSFVAGQEKTGKKICLPNPDGGQICADEVKSITKSFTASISKLITDPIRVIGGGIGYFMRVIQLNLNTLKDAPRAYLAQCKTTEEYLLGTCSGEDVAPRYMKTNPSTIVGAYCSVQQDTVTNETINFKICKDLGSDHCQKPVTSNDKFYFLDEKSPYRLKLASMVIDGATLITTGSLTPMNPGQWQKSLGHGGRNRSCGGNDKSHFEIWYIPNDVTDLELLDFNYWRNNAAKLKYHPDPGQTDAKGYMNVVLNLKVKAGHYAIFAPVDSACISSKTVIVSQDGIEKETSTNLVAVGESSLIKFSIGPTKEQYCAKLTLNSNMPGGSSGAKPGEEVLTQVGNDQVMCQLDNSYDLALNSACGGLYGDQVKSDYGCSSNPSLIQQFLTKNPDNLQKYLDITGRPGLNLNNLSSNICCRAIFPNILKEFSASDCPI